MQLNPKSKSATYSIDSLQDVELCIEDIEKIALENDSVSSEVARSICSALSRIRTALSLKQGVRRHEKWAPELQQTKAGN